MRYTILLILCMIIVIPASNEIRASNTVTGMIISLSPGSLEVKRGPREYSFSITEKTLVFYKKKKVERDFLQVCQRVTVFYSLNRKKRWAVRLIILKNSDCHR